MRGEVRAEARRVGLGYRGQLAPPHQLEGLGSAVSSPSGVRASFQNPKNQQRLETTIV